jgi:hypothetical protein
MGNCCASSKEEYTKKDLDNIIRIQAALRTFKAKKELK